MDVNKKREILFRGKTEKGEWLFGFYHNETSIESPSSDRKITRHHIYTQDFDKFIIPETVGQFTGLTDMNGKKIFEGDILADYFGKIYGVVEYGEGSFDSGILKYTGFYCKALDKFSGGNLYNESNKDYWDRHQVIGNIYDNPELLKIEKWENPKEKKE